MIEDLEDLVLEPERCLVCGCTDDDCSDCVERTGELAMASPTLLLGDRS